MKVLVVGGGGREHALVWKVAKSPRVKKIYCAPGNPGTMQSAQSVEIAPDDVRGLAEWAEGNGIDLTIVGPEAPLVKGIAGEFGRRGLTLVGPSQMAAELEGSKVFAKTSLQQWGVPTADAAIFEDEERASQHVKSRGAPLVIKADGLAQGKGVVVVHSEEEGLRAIHQIMGQGVFGEAGRRVLVEDYLEGEEVSMIGLTDGEDVLLMTPSQDHKRLLNKDEGPNTGGMGAYAPVPHVADGWVSRIEKEIFMPTIRGMASMGRSYRGVLYAGLMMTKDGPKVLEFNVRFGDPETQVLLPRLENDLIDLCEAVVQGRVARASLAWSPRSAVCVVAVAKGYPESPVKGTRLKGLEAAFKVPDVLVFQAGTALVESELVTMGGRVLNVVGQGDTLKEAVTRAYMGINKIRFEGMHFRTDIGWRAFVRETSAPSAELRAQRSARGANA